MPPKQEKRMTDAPARVLKGQHNNADLGRRNMGMMADTCRPIRYGQVYTETTYTSTSSKASRIRPSAMRDKVRSRRATRPRVGNTVVPD